MLISVCVLDGGAKVKTVKNQRKGKRKMES
jgi:hypothetical protein